MWSPKVFAKYWALQVAGTALIALILVVLQEPLAIPTWLVWTIVALWVLKDAALYPFVWRSYDPDYPSMLSIEGEVGVATDRIDPSGPVRVRGARWRATLAHGARPVDKGEAVRVWERRGLTLVVAALDDAKDRD
jgi:membrane-bound ClpP family serine protease